MDYSDDKYRHACDSGNLGVKPDNGDMYTRLFDNEDGNASTLATEMARLSRLPTPDVNLARLPVSTSTVARRTNSQMRRFLLLRTKASSLGVRTLIFFWQQDT